MRKGGKLEGWKVEKLGDVIQKTETINPLQTPNKEFIYIDVSSVNNKTLSIEETSLIKGKDAPSRARKLIKADDVIFATVRPTLKRIAVIPEEYDHQVCSTGYFVLRGKEFINNKYLFYYLQTDNFNERMENLQKGASYPAVTDTEVKEQIISYPPLPEQQRIVSVLDKAFASIAQAKSNAERNLVNARELFESVLHSFFEEMGEGWKTFQLEELTEQGSPITYGVVKPGEYGDIRFVRGGDISQGRVLVDQLRTITKEISEQYKRTLLRGGELLMCLVGQPGQVAVAPDELAGANIARQVGLIRLRKDVNSEFVRYFLQSKNGEKALGAYTGGSVQQVINLGDLRMVEIPIPSLAEQSAIVGRLEALSAETGRLEEIYQQKVESLEELKKSVLEKAFEGEL